MESKPAVDPNAGSYTVRTRQKQHFAEVDERKKFEYDTFRHLPYSWSKEEDKLEEYQKYPRQNEFTSILWKKWLPYWYFDTPDNADCHKKVMMTAKWGAAAGAIITVYDLVYFAKPKTSSQMLTVVIRDTVPLTCAAMLASSVQCCVAAFRHNKDDMLSFIAGGAAFGLFWGMRRGSTGWGALYMFYGSLAGFTTKCMNRRNKSLFPKMPYPGYAVSGAWGNKYGGDLTLGIRFYDDPGGRRPF